VRDANSRLVYSTGGEVPKGPTVREKPAKPSAATPGRGGVRLRLDRRASDRLMTLVSGLPGPERALQQMLRELKAACGAGGALKNGVLELQGDQRDRLEAFLGARGIASKRAGG
jgi:translation initiation factor 1